MNYKQYIDEASRLGYKVGPMLKLAGYSRDSAYKDAKNNQDTVSQKYLTILDAIKYQQLSSDETGKLIRQAVSSNDKTVQSLLAALRTALDESSSK